jgi:DNA repair protein SbcD/Mre11
MRVVHLSDLHLGHRAFARVERGGNLRERDLSGIFHQAVQEIGRLSPDVVLIAGDLFDHPDPPSTAFLALTRGVRRLQELLPEVPLLAIAGECDTPSAVGDPGPVAVLDALPGVEAAAGAPRAVHVRRLGLHVLMVPHRAVVRPPYPELRPDPDARWNILLIRGHPRAPGSAAGAPLPGDAGAPFRFDPRGWDYVAVGGLHGATSWGSRVRASGSLERVGPDPWREAGEEKGFLLVDLGSGDAAFHPVAARPVVDLAPVRVDPGAPEAGTRRLRELLESYPGGVDGKILKVRLRGDILSPTEGISPGLLAGLRRRATHVELRVEGPEEVEMRGRDVARAGSRGFPLPKAPRLTWAVGGGRRGEVPLHPGLWLVTATSADDLERMAQALEQGPGQMGAETGGAPDEEPGLRIAIEGAGDIAFPARPSHRDEPRQVPPSPPSTEPRGTSGSGPASPPEPPASSAELHGEWIEAEGDAEVRALDWARERQEADSRLLAYRERALELRERIRTLREEGPDARCPTCRRPLSEAHPGLLELLEEEWEDVVQDGTWWKKRRSQLDEKPPELLSLERRALEMRARLEEGIGMAGPSHPSVPGPGDPSEGPVERRLLRRAGFLLRRATDGRLDGLRQVDDRTLHVVDAEGRARPPARGEEDLVALAMQAAEAGLEGQEQARSRASRVLGIRLLSAGRGGVPRAALARLLDEVAASGESDCWIAVVPQGVSEALPHRIEGAIELVRDEDRRPRMRVARPGRARLVVDSSGSASEPGAGGRRPR